jgi:hypothetical protein
MTSNKIDVVCSVKVADQLRKNMPAKDFHQFSIMVSEPEVVECRGHDYGDDSL